MLRYKYIGPLLQISLFFHLAYGQTRVIGIDKCYELARQNYPLIRKHDLIARSSDYSLDNAGKSYLPHFTISGFASYQSQTINFQEVVGGPGILIPPLSKDQYKIQAEVNQKIYDGGQVKYERDLLKVNEFSQQQSLEVDLYTLRERINQLYFSILLLDEQIRQNEIRKEDFRSSADKARAAFEHGTAYKSNVDELEAEVVNAEMTNIELNTNRKAYSDMLAIFIGQPVDEHVVLILPPALINDPVVRRPELSLFDLERNRFDVQEKQLKSEYLPKVNAFVQAAYGRPTLNFVSDNFGGWWVAGVRLFWELGSLYTIKNNRANLKINKEYLELDKETFLFNTSLNLTKQNTEMLKYAALLQKDDQVISLRAAVATAAKAQFENGVVTVHDYISKTNEENSARQTRILHNIQLIQAQYQYKITSGN